MRILILSHRDIMNPDSGAGEKLTHELAKRWVLAGHTVTIFSSAFSHAAPEDMIDDIRVVRNGSPYLKSLYAYLYASKRIKREIDIVIDETDKLPFFSKLYAPRRTILLASDVIGERAKILYPPVISTFWQILEWLYLLIYQGSPTFVLSAAVRDALIARGFAKEYIFVLPRGVSVPDQFVMPQKERNPTFMFLGKLSAEKGAGDVIETFLLIAKNNPTAQFWVVGAGNEKYTQGLRNKVLQYSLQERVKFYGFVSEDIKYQLLARTHILLLPSKYEAWGMTVQEAGIVGTPTIAYQTAGMQSVIIHGKSGLIVPPTPLDLAKSAVYAVQDLERYVTMQTEAQNMAKQYSWDVTADLGLRVLQSVYQSLQKQKPVRKK